MMKNFAFIAMFISFTVFGHGENKPGPHGGEIRMPGNFHTELIVEGSTARIYLLDMAFKNPLTEKSQVSVSAEGKSGVVKPHCVEKKSFFECHFPKDLKNYKSLVIKPVRKGQKGREAHYTLPLKFKSNTQPAEDHSHHQH
jgi:hypothetical protein